MSQTPNSPTQPSIVVYPSSTLPIFTPQGRASANPTTPPQTGGPGGVAVTSSNNTRMGTHLGASEGGTLNSRRDIASRLVGAVPEYRFRYMLDSVFPLLNTDIVLPNREQLIDAGILDSATGRWVLFKERPSESEKTENAYFKPFPKLCEEIVDLIQKLSPKYTAGITCHAACSPNRTLYSDRNNTSRPDLYFLLNLLRSVVPGGASWLDIACVGEFKKDQKLENLIDNMKKIIWSGTHIVRNDLSRRFAPGITIEDVVLRLWYFSRGGVMVSAAMDWLHDFKSFVRLVASLAFGTIEDLGYSSFIKPVLENNETRYVFTINGINYITTGEILSEFRARNLLGRGTRVLVVRLLFDPSGLYIKMALKEYWCSLNTEHEAILSENVRYAATQAGINPDDFLLKIREKGNFFVLGPDGFKEDTTETAIRHIETPDRIYAPSDLKQKDAKVNPNPAILAVGEVPGQKTGDTAVDMQYTDESREVMVHPFHHRRHVFLVFEEVGVTLQNLTNTVSLFRGMREGIKSIYYLHKSGYVHRDISTGNIMLFKGKALLLDLEYIKKISQNDHLGPSDHMKTGTAQFMAREVQINMYKHRPQDIAPNFGESYETSQVEKGNSLLAAAPVITNAVNGNGAVNLSSTSQAPSRKHQLDSPEDKTGENKKPARGEFQQMIHDTFEGIVKSHKPAPFRYNTGHDIESYFWIFLWSIFYHIPTSDRSYDVRELLKCAFDIFPEERNVLSYIRIAALEKPTTLTTYLQRVHPIFESVKKPVGRVALAMIFMHRNMQKDLPAAVNPTGEYIYKSFFDELSDICKLPVYKNTSIMFATNTMNKIPNNAESVHCPVEESNWPGKIN